MGRPAGWMRQLTGRDTMRSPGAPSHRRKTYPTRKEACQDVFDFIEMFHNPKRRHSHASDLSLLEDEQQYFRRLGSV